MSAALDEYLKYCEQEIEYGVVLAKVPDMLRSIRKKGKATNQHHWSVIGKLIGYTENAQELLHRRFNLTAVCESCHKQEFLLPPGVRSTAKPCCREAASQPVSTLHEFLKSTKAYPINSKTSTIEEMFGKHVAACSASELFTQEELGTINTLLGPVLSPVPSSDFYNCDTPNDQRLIDFHETSELLNSRLTYVVDGLFTSVCQLYNITEPKSIKNFDNLYHKFSFFKDDQKTQEIEVILEEVYRCTGKLKNLNELKKSAYWVEDVNFPLSKPDRVNALRHYLLLSNIVDLLQDRVAIPMEVENMDTSFASICHSKEEQMEKLKQKCVRYLSELEEQMSLLSER